MYGAFWCSHCYEQKQKFGLDAMQAFPYVECFPEGWKRVSDAFWIIGVHIMALYEFLKDVSGLIFNSAPQLAVFVPVFSVGR